MLNKIFPLIFSILFFVIIIFFWDYIHLPYDENNQVIGEYFNKKFNPSNDILRFLIVIGIPVITYLFLYLNNDQTLSFKINSNNFFLKKNIYKTTDSLKKYLYFFIFVIFIEFLSIDFSRFINNLDVFHMGTFLVPPINYLETNLLFLSTQYDYGLISNNLGLIYYYLFGYYSPGSIIFIFLLLTFLIKLFLLLITKKIVNLFIFESETKIFLFTIFATIAIFLPDYYDNYKYFHPRAFLYLFFVYFLGSEISKNNKNNYKFIFTGLFSLLSVLWWYDIGIFTNCLIFISILYLIINKEFKNIFIILFSVILIWSIFLLFSSFEEIIEFWSQFKFNFSDELQYLLGIEFKKPFTSHSGRWTKAILIIYISSLMLVHLNFNRKIIIDSRLKIFINFFFLSGIFLFNSALIRSDSYHLKYSSGIYTLLFIFLILYFFFIKIENKINFNLFFKKFYLSRVTNLILFIFLILNSLGILKNNNHNNSFKDLNIYNFKSNILKLVTASDEMFLDDEKIDVIQKYKKISINDECVQIFSDDVAFAYFLKKKTCTPYFNSAQILVGVSEEDFLNKFKSSKVEIVLYESKNRFLSNKLNMPKTIDYLNNNYFLLENYKGYLFFKKKK